jgi:hypothetical protein
VAENLQVGTNAQVRYNFTMEVGEITSRVEVSVASDALLTESAASVGVVLPQQRVTDLPLVGQNVLDLLDVLPGFRESPVGDRFSTVGGLDLNYVNTTINGLSTVSSRDAANFWGRQVMTTNVINPDLVGEIRLILSPVDAELGRGNSQVQIQTRSGTNRYAGSAVWNVVNTALDANTWANKRNPGPPTQPNWYNINQFTGSYGGPIVRNKTFFYALYDKQIVRRRTLATTPVLTDTARQGIWRYWEGWNPGEALRADPTSFNNVNGTIASVDFNGNPIAPTYNPDGTTPYNLGGLRCFSVFGDMKVNPTNGALVPFTANDCPGGTAVINAAPWDNLRSTTDTTGFIAKILPLMPQPNYFAAFGGFPSNQNPSIPDGLNTGLYRYLQTTSGTSAINASIGVAAGPNDYNGRDQINLKVDHNFNTKHRLSVSWTWEKDSGEGSIAAWDARLNGNIRRVPQFVTVNGTSTLSPVLVNEARFGVNYSSEWASPAWANLDNSETTAEARQFILYGNTNPTNGKQYPVLFNPGTNWNGFMNFGSFDFANYSPLWNYADTLRWTRGKHSFSFGGEYRRPQTTGFNNSAYIGANVGNAGGVLTPQFFSANNTSNGSASLPGFLGTSRGNVGTLLNTFYGALNAATGFGGSLNTGYWIDGQSDLINGTWQDVTTATNRIPSADPYGHQTRTQTSNEWSFFAKDDYKITSRLTLNLGVRWDFAGSPYLSEGLTNRFDGDGLAMFGPSRPTSGDLFANWLTPGNLYLTGYGSNAANPQQCVQGAANPNGIPTSNCDPNLMAQVLFVGPETDHPDQTLVPQIGRFSPALGFSWQVPWFGDGKTTVRGGFQRTSGQAGSAFTGGLLSGPGADGTTQGVNTSDPTLQAIFAQRALSLQDLPLVVPAVPSRAPTDQVFPVGARRANITYGTYGPEYTLPYTDNWTLSIQRSLTSNVTLEVRSVNTYGKKLHGTAGSFSTAGTFDINTVNVYHNPELFNALEATRAGLNDPLFDEMFMGLNLVGGAGSGPVGTVVGTTLQRGSDHLRRANAFRTNLANGNYAAVVSSMLTQNPQGLQAVPTVNGAAYLTSQRMLRNGCDRLANNLTSGFVNPDTGGTILPRCFSENYLITNPQLNSAIYTRNLGSSDYNSLEATVTLRPIYGIGLQATYGYSKTMVQAGSGFTDPLRPELDYGLSIQSAGHDFRTNGTVELPIGPNKLLLPNSSGWLARALEQWKMGFILNMSSGSPRTFLSGTNHLYANGRPNIVGPWDNPKGEVQWNGQNGNFFDETYATYPDPQCANVGSQLTSLCSLRALARVVDAGTPGAIALPNGQFGIPLLEHPVPGEQGNLGSFTMNTFGRWSLDGNLSKTFAISESKSIQVRVDATNIFNHPTPSDPTGLNNQGSSFSDNFGLITNKTGSRNFQAKLRLSF